LPAYSADFNRIENRWSSMKRALPDLIPKCETLQGAVYTHSKPTFCSLWGKL
jgi:hypothetical protein